MTGKEIYALGKASPEAKVKVPLSLVHTAPRLIFAQNWRAEFWYFMQKVDGKTVYVSAPRLCLTFELPSKKLLDFKSFKGSDKDTLGTAPELISKEFYLFLNDYLNFCGLITTKTPDAETLTQAEKMWKQTLPQFLRIRIGNILTGTNTENKETLAAAQIESSSSEYYWQMAQAIQSGNHSDYLAAKKKYDEAKARSATVKVS